MPRVLWYVIFLMNAIALTLSLVVFFLIAQFQRYDAALVLIPPLQWYMLIVLPISMLMGPLLLRWFKRMTVMGIMIFILGGGLLWLTMDTLAEEHEPRTEVRDRYGNLDQNQWGETRYEENPAYKLYKDRERVRYILVAALLLTGTGMIIGGAFGKSLRSPIEDIPEQYRDAHRIR